MLYNKVKTQIKTGKLKQYYALKPSNQVNKQNWYAKDNKICRPGQDRKIPSGWLIGLEGQILN